MFGPIPYGSWRTRRGTRVRVGGCCLPIPLALGAALGAAGLATGRVVRRGARRRRGMGFLDRAV
jgi:hypothetical protein